MTGIRRDSMQELGRADRPAAPRRPGIEGAEGATHPTVTVGRISRCRLRTFVVPLPAVSG